MNDVLGKETKVAKVLSTEANVEKARDGRLQTNQDPGNGPTPAGEEPQVLEEICVEELAIDGICGVY